MNDVNDEGVSVVVVHREVMEIDEEGSSMDSLMEKVQLRA